MSRRSRPLVSAERLKQVLDEGERNPLLLDVRWQLNAPSQRAEYDRAHLPGAQWVEFEEVLTGTPGAGGRHPMPDPEPFERAMRAAGVTDDRPVVIYDQANSLAASRAWWLLKHFGHTDVHVLDGGIDAWVAAGYPVTAQVTPEPEGDFVATPGCTTLLEADHAADLAYRSVLLDARPADRFRGENETIDPVAGHIPGAVSMPALTNVDESGKFLPPDDLALRFTAAGVQPDTEVGVYCGSGVQASHLALALEASGINPRTGVYVGSWSHWITDPERPIEV
ncbi:sulfurtransferase [Calidifontibacter indicus]|uniref:Thiosulfate/3-mercaptopyruvate sulfurtransferase n=1 Tax=Calidifontibacter indicus TaxID=419650 RepID=A0A3D9V152_9MICO|nr:sulfurtransferase [Calidifontibacter indicus]REF30821.1 thiosulfate/3-mercaptopyruvate sulfurtransferase [Calidifontibacter indicus]